MELVEECDAHFSAAVESGLIPPGTILTDRAGRHSVVVRADGTVALGMIVGSIHKIGALAQGLPACNGWTFWHMAEGGRRAPIDEMRSTIRAAMRAGGAEV